MNIRYDNKLKAMSTEVRTNSTIRAALAVVDACNTGVLPKDVAKRVYQYLDMPYAYYYGEQELSLMDRFLTHPHALRTKSGMLNVLGLLNIAGGYTNKSLYGGFTPKGVKYGHIRISDAFYILLNIPKHMDDELVEVGGIVAHSEDYSYEEHELYVGVM